MSSGYPHHPHLPPAAMVSPYMARHGVPMAPAAPPQTGALDPQVEGRRQELEELFSGAPRGVARMASRWVVTHRPEWTTDAIVVGTVAIGDRVKSLAPGQATPLRLEVPTTTAFYGLSISTRVPKKNEAVISNTDLVFSLQNSVGHYRFGSPSHMCPVAAFDPHGHGFTMVSPFMMREGGVRIELVNQSEDQAYAVVVSVMGLGLYSNTGGQ